MAIGSTLIFKPKGDKKMPGTLHMDVDTCRTVQKGILNTKDQIDQQLTAVKNAVDGMVGTTWIAPGATQYHGDFQTWVSQLTQLSQQLADLATRLSTEIDQWEQAAQQA